MRGAIRRALSEGEGVGLPSTVVDGVAVGSGLAVGDVIGPGEEVPPRRSRGALARCPVAVGLGIAVGNGAVGAFITGTGVTLGASDGDGIGVVSGFLTGAGVTLATTDGAGIGVCAIRAGMAAGAEAPGAICGFSKRFGGASGGGVASALILARARSASG